jgi:hypothetical protein
MDAERYYDDVKLGDEEELDLEYQQAPPKQRTKRRFTIRLFLKAILLIGAVVFLIGIRSRFSKSSCLVIPTST